MSADNPLRPTIYKGVDECVPHIRAVESLCDRLVQFREPELFSDAHAKTVVLMLLAVESGWTSGGLEWIGNHFNRARLVGRSLYFSVQMTDVGTKVVRVELPPAAELHLLAFAHRKGGLDALDKLFGQESKPLPRAFKELQLALGVEKVVTLANFSSCIRFRATSHLPNLMVTLLSEEPGAQHPTTLTPLLGSKQFCEVSAEASFRNLLASEPAEARANARWKPQERSDAQAEWNVEAEQVLKNMLRNLSEVHAKVQTKCELRQELSEVACRRAIASLLDLGLPEASSAVFAARWAAHRFNGKQSPSAETVGGYVGIFFFSGFFRLESSFDLLEWSVEDWEEFAKGIMDRTHTGDSERSYSNRLDDLLRFASRELGFDSPNLGIEIEPRAESVLRAFVIGPNRLDSMVRALIGRDTRHHKQLAAAILLGYYAGFRPLEVVNCPLISVVGSARDLTILIEDSKTADSRRWVPLHLLAPRWAVEFLVQFRDERAAEFRSRRKRKQAALFGLEGRIEALDRNSLITPAIRWLKEVFGSDVVFYSLRHSFASLIFIRIMMFRHPQLRDSLADGAHEIFSDNHLRALRQLFAAPEFGAPDIPATSIITLARLMGHSGYVTLFERYVHTTYEVLTVILAEWFDQQRERKLSRVACGLLVGRTSPASLAKLPSTVGGLVEYLRGFGTRIGVTAS